jgi:ParB family chromosome partitioning protein
LGRGFESLIPTQVVEEALDPTAHTDEKLSKLREVPIESVTASSDQPRKDFEPEALKELAASIKAHGVLQPLVVTEVSSGKYQIIAGERRWRASKIAGLKILPVVVRSLSAQHTLEVALIENVQRRDLQPLELATAYLKLHDQFNMTYKAIGQRVGKTLGAVNNTVRVLTLPAEVKQALQNQKITEGHAKALLGLASPQQQIETLKLVIAQGWSVRRTENYVAQNRVNKKSNDKKPAITRTQTSATKDLANRLQTSVYLQPKHRGGRLVLEYKTQADLERLLGKLKTD